VTVASWFIIVGGVMQVAGVIVTFTGAMRTWNEFSPDERLFANEMRHVRSFAYSIHRRFRALINRPVPARVSSVRGGAAIRSSGRGNLTTNYSAIDTDDDISDILKELDHRTRELRGDMNRITSQLFKELPELRQRLDVIEGQLTESVARLERQDRQVATGGIKGILTGLALVGLGVVVQSVSIFV
jgi:hypothetical protein